MERVKSINVSNKWGTGVKRSKTPKCTWQSKTLVSKNLLKPEIVCEQQKGRELEMSKRWESQSADMYLYLEIYLRAANIKSMWPSLQRYELMPILPMSYGKFASDI
jgi:hypothetical protein